MVWLPSSNGNFSVKSAFTTIAQLDSVSSDPFFHIIWKWCGLERIKLFLWLTANDSLHTNAFRHYRHLSNSPS